MIPFFRTVSNATTGAGGGIHNNNEGSAKNVTIAHNEASQGPGLHAMPGTSFVIQNTILAQNHTDATPSLSRDCSGDVSSNGNSMIGNTTGCALALTGSDLTNVDPMLLPLTGIAGSTPLHALSIGSPAIDAGFKGAPSTNSCLTIDQRGLPRPKDGDRDGKAICDIGAFELFMLSIYLPLVQSGLP